MENNILLNQLKIFYENTKNLETLFKILKRASLHLSVVGLKFEFLGKLILIPPLFPPMILILNI